MNTAVFCDQPSVEVSVFNTLAGGLFVLANHDEQSLKVLVTTTLPVKNLSRITSDGLQPLRREGAGWKIVLRPSERAVLEWK